MQNKSRAERRRETLRTKDTKTLPEKIKPFLTFKHPVTRFCLVFAALLIIFSLFLTAYLAYLASTDCPGHPADH